MKKGKGKRKSASLRYARSIVFGIFWMLVKMTANYR